MLELVVDIDLSTLNVSGQGRMQLLNLILMYTFNPTIPLYHYYDHYTTPLPLVHKLATKYSQKASKRQYGNIHIIQMIIQEKEMVHTASTASITGGGGGGGKANSSATYSTTQQARMSLQQHKHKRSKRNGEGERLKAL